jgi:hypothetical protein
MKPQPAKYTRERPVRKVELWNCFYGRRGFKSVQVDAAKAIIGANAPRYLLRKEYIEEIDTGEVLSYNLTEVGKRWLTDGMVRYLRNHPLDRAKLNYFPNTL